MKMQRVTFSSYLSKIIIIAALYFTLPLLFAFVGELSTTVSFIGSVVFFFIMLFVSVQLLLGRRYLKFYLTAFVVLIALGLTHYLSLVDSSYFLSDGNPAQTFWKEYLSVFNCLDNLISDRHSLGLLYFDKEDWYVSHPEIWRIISWPTTFLGHKWLNYAPLNAFSSLLASVNIMVWYHSQNNQSKSNNEQVRLYLLFFTVFFPQFILCDTLWRDPFGIALISIGLVLLSLSESPITKVLSFVCLACFSFLQRTAYLLIAGVTYAFRELNVKKTIQKFILFPVFVILLLGLLYVFNNLESEEYVSGYVNDMSILALPIKFIFGLIGPFPWTQFTYIRQFNAACNFQLRDYVTGTFQMGYLFAIIANWKNISFKKLDFMTIMGFGIALSGFITKMMHIGYISEGLFFTLPWFFSQIGSKYKKYFWLSFVFLVFLNILTIILGTSGITNFYR